MHSEIVFSGCIEEGRGNVYREAFHLGDDRPPPLKGREC